MNNKKYDKTVKTVEALIRKYWADKPQFAKVDIYTWSDNRKYGLRVAEVSLSSVDPVRGTGGGSSYMQSDAGCGDALFAVERAILEIHHALNEMNEEEMFDLIDVKWRMIKSVLGDDAAKAFADAEYPKENAAE